MDDKDTNSKELSTSALAKELKISTQSMFQRLLEEGFITKNEAVWDLTNAGKSKGGVYKHSDKYGRYIVWPASIIVELEDSHEGTGNNLLTATVIGKSLDIPANRINSILSELGWIKKDIVKGWQITELGKRLGGIQSKYKTTGIPFVRWPENIIKNKILTASVREAKGDISPVSQEQHQNMVSNTVEFRDKFKAEHRAQDGHYVRSKSELIIDNWLYVSKVVHAYERKLPIEEDLYCDFYIPTGKVYIEYWGLEEDKYIARKEKKLEIYKKYSLNLIQLTDKDVLNLEDTLLAKLLEFGIPVE
jgi:hypothetical protein